MSESIRQAATTLAVAVVSAVATPVLLLDDAYSVLAASQAFCEAFDFEPGDVTGRSIFDLGDGEWNLPRLRSLVIAARQADTAIPTYELSLKRPGREPSSLRVSAARLNPADDGGTRLLLTIVDVTGERAVQDLMDRLVTEKELLVREVQHRVANSLQIVASVLLQSARKVQSEETRGHLRDAHQRVMSVAAVQRQLSQSSQSRVTVRPYLVQLCQSLGASMIGDHDQLRIDVTGDESDTAPGVSVSLGLIVTELVINALKHAFPDDRKGTITVDYRTVPGGWTLSVMDDGIGMAGAGGRPRPGLGTSLVQALASQLSAGITIADLAPGTRVSITHGLPDQLAAQVPPSAIQPI